MAQNMDGESRYDVVFGETFALYSKEEYLEFMAPFQVRFERNGLSTEIFKGKSCLDAGCGNGLGLLLGTVRGLD